MGHFNAETFFEILPDLLNPWIVKFQHFTGIIKNKMIMLFQHGRFFKLSIVRPELVFGDQVTIQQQFNRIVQGCPADPVFVIFHPDVQCLNVKMSFRGKDLPENGVAFRGFTVTMPFKVIRKNQTDIFKSIFVGFFNHGLNFGSKIVFYNYLEQIKINFLIHTGHMYNSFHVFKLCKRIIQDRGILNIKRHLSFG